MMQRIGIVAAPILFTLGLSGVCHGQVPTFTFAWQTSGFYVGDLDGDGIGEYVETQATSGSWTKVFDASTHALKWSNLPQGGGGQYYYTGIADKSVSDVWRSTTLGTPIRDYTGDGVKELIMTLADGGLTHLMVQDITTGQNLLDLTQLATLGPLVALGAADIDGDGVIELLIQGAYGALSVYKAPALPTSVNPPPTGSGNATPLLATIAPNPVLPSGRASLSLTIPSAGSVSVRFFNATGRQVREMTLSAQPAGRSTIPWDGRDQEGRLLPSGSYAYLVAAGGAVVASREIVLR